MTLACFGSLLLMVSSALASAGSLADERQKWVLQLAFFASLDNALVFRDQLADAGFEATVLSTGEPGKQRYRVVCGRADEPSGLDDLRGLIENATGHRGHAVADPLEGGKSRKVAAADIFDRPQARYLLAQAGPGNDVASPMRASGYDPGLSRTPQQEIDSMPGFTVAGMPLMPTLGLSLGYDDNVTASNTDQVSSWFYMISPAIRGEIPTDHSVLRLTAAADIVRYSDSPIDDRNSWFVRGDWAWDISTRQNLNLFAQYSEGADQRGEGRRQGDEGLIPLEPDEWKRWAYGGAWDYGAVGSRGRLTLRAGASDLTYTNNRGDGTEADPGTTLLDRDWQYYGGTFYWRVAPKTSLLADYMYTDMNYKQAESSDSEIHTWMLGVTWDATARTSGRISYGNQKREFADPTREDYSGPAWMASVNWRPRTYSLFTLTATRNTQEPDGNGDYVLRQDLTLSWLHDWATRFGTTVDIGYGQDDYRPDGRSDDLWYWGVGARYRFNQHFRFGASITGYDRSSEIVEFSYNRMVYLLTLEASF